MAAMPMPVPIQAPRQGAGHGEESRGRREGARGHPLGGLQVDERAMGCLLLDQGGVDLEQPGRP